MDDISATLKRLWECLLTYILGLNESYKPVWGIKIYIYSW